MSSPRAVIKQTLTGVVAHAIDPDGSLGIRLLGEWDTAGSVIMAANILKNDCFGTEFCLELFGASRSIIDSYPNDFLITFVEGEDFFDKGEWVVTPA